ncbi:hypothetical protein DZB91_23425 [Brevibacillus sp. VP]|uniref:hypothetical protein n=1 Tax=Brevibacillus sp. VP TaxID=2293326 RepID=UPI000E2E9781|nr:hypothetical protein [Brevibacillus sp. VP]RFB28394.1 hypothetical protein DZB91_23425 [Brevibacillus sp. VP]
MILTKPKPLSQIEQEKKDEKMPITTLGEEVAQTKLELLQKNEVMQSFGEELARLRLEIIKLKGGVQ